MEEARIVEFTASARTVGPQVDPSTAPRCTLKATFFFAFRPTPAAPVKVYIPVLR